VPDFFDGWSSPGMGESPEIAPLVPATGPSDADLITRARAGDDRAYELLYRRHRSAALRYARSLPSSPADVEDIVAEAFARVLAALRAGNGPEEAFRPYLLSAVRNAFYDLVRRSGREQPVDDVSPYDSGQPFTDPVTHGEERVLIARAFDKLPERWRMVLWHTEVEGENPAAVAPLLGISPNAVSALAYRAREGLRESYLQAHLATARDRGCRRTVDKLAAYTRGNLSRAEKQRVRDHLDGCAHCRLLFRELADVNARLGALLGPIVLGSGVAGLVAGGTAVGAGEAVALGTAAGSTSTGPSVLAQFVKRLARRRDVQLGTGTVAAAVAAVALVLSNQPSGPQARPPSAQAPATPAPTVVQPSTVEEPAPRTSTPATTPERTSIVPPSDSPPTPTTTTTPSQPAPPAPPPALISVQLVVQPVGSLLLGRLGIVAMTLTNTTGISTGPLTATITVPSGIVLGAAYAGDGWICTALLVITCLRDSLAPGASTNAYIMIAIGLGAGDGSPSVQVTGPGITPVDATATQGVQSNGLAAVAAMDRSATVVTAGNALLSCSSLQFGCAQARAGHGGKLDNNDWLMVPYVDPAAPFGGGLPLGSAVSGAALTIPGKVAWAGLYWAGSGPPPANPVAYVRPPGASSYTAVTAARVDKMTLGGSGPAYQVRADVTALAAAAGSGTWWVGVPAGAFATGTNRFGGWALLVIADDGGPVRTIAVFDGPVVLTSGASFLSTVYGAVSSLATVGFIGWEGDRGRHGDRISLASVLGGPDANNIAASRAAGTAPGWNTFGTDARVFTGMLGGGPEPTVRASTSGDVWAIGALAVVAPKT